MGTAFDMLFEQRTQRREGQHADPDHDPSVFPLATQPVRPWDPKYLKAMLTRAVHGRAISLLTEKCYAATVDCRLVATRFFGVPRKKACVYVNTPLPREAAFSAL